MICPIREGVSGKAPSEDSSRRDRARSRWVVCAFMDLSDDLKLAPAYLALGERVVAMLGRAQPEAAFWARA
jgi:hypothetical protein